MSIFLYAIIFLVGSIVGGYIWVLALDAYHRRDMRRVARKRQGYNATQFRAYFAAEGIPGDICDTVYESLPEICHGVRNFPVQPDDDLEELYRIGRMGGLTIDLVLLSVGEKLGLPLPEDEVVADIWNKINWTGKAQDIVRYFDELRKMNLALHSG